MDNGKVCSRCGEWKPEQCFTPRKDRPIGMTPDCKECRRIAATQRRRDKPEDNRIAVAKWTSNHIEEKRAYSKLWRATHTEEWKSWNQSNRHRLEEHTRRYRLKNPHVGRACVQRRRARSLLVGGAFTEHEWLALCSKHGNKCLCCGSQERLVRDHVIPISKGGPNSIDNIQPLCVHCNAVKGAKTMDYR